MKHIKLGWKLMIIVAMAIATTVFVAICGISGMDRIGSLTSQNAYDESIADQVERAMLRLDHYNELYQQGLLSLEEAKKQGADMLRDLRYGKSGYFWADDVDGNNIVLLGSKTEGTNRIDTVDANGYAMVKQLIKVGQQENGGYVDYMFPKEGETEPKEKRGYTKYYEPFGWVIGTGNYLEDMEEVLTDSQMQVAEVNQHWIRVMLIVALFLTVLIVLVSVYIVRDISKSLKGVLGLMEKLQNGDLTVRAAERDTKRRDEFGQLFQATAYLAVTLQRIVGDVRKQTEELLQGVGAAGERMQSLNGEIGVVFDTTQDLSASMEETAASTHEIEAMMNEMKDVSNAVESRSVSGSARAEEVQGRAEKVKKEVKGSVHRIADTCDEIRGGLQEAVKEAEVVKEIEGMANAINEITEQTTLLALNVSIEAARAGDSGKGFAVVAAEVQQLAEESKVTVENIQKTIEQVDHAVAHLSHSATGLLQFVSEDVSNSFEDFLNVVEEYSKDADYIEELADWFCQTSETMRGSVGDVGKAIEDIVGVTSDGAQDITDIASRNSNVKEQSGQVLDIMETAEQAMNTLAGSVEHFKV